MACAMLFISPSLPFTPPAFVNDTEAAAQSQERMTLLQSRCHRILTGLFLGGGGWFSDRETSGRGLACRFTLGLALGFSCSSFLAAASMDAAAPRSSVSAMTVGSSGSTHSEPGRGTSQILTPVSRGRLGTGGGGYAKDLV